jgi:cell division transport system permease protein
MKTTLKRILKTGFLNFKRNGLVSFVSVLVTTIALSVMMMLFLTRAIFTHSLDDIEKKVDIKISFNIGTREENIVTLRQKIEALPEVASVTFISAEEELKLFRERHANDYLTLQALEEVGTNPLGGALNIKAFNAFQYESIAQFLESDDPTVQESRRYVSKINFTDNKLIIERINTIVTTGQKVGTILVLLLALVAIVVTYNTIRLTIHYSREEIAVMRLVGASRSYVRGPFMVEGILYGFIGAFFTILIFWPITYYLGIKMTSFLSIDLYQYFISNFFFIAPIVFLGW